MTALRVVFLEGSQGGVTGGSLTGLLPIMTALRRDGAEPHLIVREPKRVAAALEAAGVPVTVVPRRRVPKEHRLQGAPAYERAKKRRLLAGALGVGRALAVVAAETVPSALALARVMRRLRPDVVHLSNGFRNNADGIIAARLIGCPSICHVKGFERYGFVERTLAPMVAAGVCMSDAIREHCLAAGVSAPVMHVVPDALDSAEFRPARAADAVRAELGLQARSPILGVVGQIQEWKGQHVALEAVERLRDRFPDVVCLVIGGVRRARGNELAADRYAERLRETVQARGLEDHVRFLGERHDVPDLVGALDVLLHTSIRPEPFGRVVLEGMALARPVIATRGGGIPDIVVDGETGIIVPPSDAAALAEAVAALATDPRRALDMGRRGLMRLESHFSVVRQLDALRRIYADAMPPRARQGLIVAGEGTG
jgi:glycosyltransferase involved in cell wall biosynthesis